MKILHHGHITKTDSHIQSIHLLSVFTYPMRLLQEALIVTCWSESKGNQHQNQRRAYKAYIPGPDFPEQGMLNTGKAFLQFL